MENFKEKIDVILSTPEPSDALIEKAELVASAVGGRVLQSVQSLEEGAVYLVLGDEGLLLRTVGKKSPGSIRVDFVGGAANHRRLHGGGTGQMVAKAVGVKKQFRPHVLDATAGLAGDAFVLAGLGCRMTLMERSKVVQQLIEDGLSRARNTDNFELTNIIERITLIPGDSSKLMHRWLQEVNQSIKEPPDVVFLDPMFPEKNSSAAVKKEMQVFQKIIGKDEDANNLLSVAIELAKYRVVVKRPKKAPFLGEQTPSHQIAGKSSRFDVYTIAKLPL
ncbi:class I SAM-dependent methyltransferase [Marinibactrum halimedae]|nr:class I SAM-dependent methyltransferase [Marinibactrum halimedae]MCD9460162.1 class I SAM-dependent methyltransferase [Marinibactrum halimedae]